MRVNNPLYNNIGIHIICSLFTVDKGEVKVLLIRRKNDPYKDMWALVGGALYNNETIEGGLRREIFEKTGLKNVNISLCNVESEVNRSSLKRMIAINYIGLIDYGSSILKDTEKTSNADWFNLDSVEKLAYDHNKILKVAREKLKDLVVSSPALKILFPNGFTMPELQRTYEIILEKKFDRRNFRKKMLTLGLVTETNKTEIFNGKKPAKKYEFASSIEINKIL